MSAAGGGGDVFKAGGDELAAVGFGEIDVRGVSGGGEFGEPGRKASGDIGSDFVAAGLNRGTDGGVDLLGH